jgi:hypothetical protein
VEALIWFSFYRSAKKQMGLPSGRPAPEAFRGGRQVGVNLRRGLYQTLKKEWIPFLGGEVIEEASACYLYRCATDGKVA